MQTCSRAQQEGIAALKSTRRDQPLERTLVMTYAEFGRRPKENQSGGTDHGTASALCDGRGAFRGPIWRTPALDKLDGNGNLPFAVDFRSQYATVLDKWWGARCVACAAGVTHRWSFSRFEDLPIHLHCLVAGLTDCTAAP